MRTAFYVALAVVFAALVGPAAFLYWRFRNTPARVWYARLATRRAELVARRAALRNGLTPPDAGLDRRRDALLGEFLASVSVQKLEDFPGIGPGTVQKLRDHQAHTVRDLFRVRFQDIPGIGPVKEQELVAARDNLRRQLAGTFDAGACPQGATFRAEVAAARTEYERLCAECSRELAAVDTALAECDRLDRLCGGLTFPNHLFGTSHGIPAETVAAPLPVVTVAPAPIPVPPPIPTPPPVLAASPALARKDSAPVVLPPRAVEKKPPEPKDLFGDLLGAPAVPLPATAPGEPAGLAALRALARFGFVVAKADGRIAQAERKAVRAYLETKFGGDPVLVRFLDVTMEEVEKAIPSEADAVAGLLAVTGEAERADLIAWAEQIASASGERNQREEDMLGRLPAALGVKQAESAVLVAPTSKPVVQPNTGLEAGATKKIDPRAALDIPADAPLSVDLIRRNFTRLSEKLDPAKAAVMGAEFVKLAEDKRAALRAAAEELIRPFGEPLDKPDAPVSADLRHNPDLDDAFGM